jgi:hypothetical protein
VLPWHSQQHSIKKAFFFAGDWQRRPAQAEDANVVLCQLAPWRFDYSGEKMSIKRTFRRVCCLLTRLLANMGAAGQTLLLSRFAGPVGAGEKRWLDGFYLDVPEEWDDPYRFFRW